MRARRGLQTRRHAFPSSGAPAHETSDADTPLDLLWGRRLAAELREQLLEAPNPNAKFDVMESALADIWRPPGSPSRRDLRARVVRATARHDASIASVTGQDRPQPKTLHRTVQTRCRRGPQTLLPHPAISARAVSRRRRASGRLDAHRATIADTSTRLISSTISDPSPASRRPAIRPAAPNFRTTSNFYNPDKPRPVRSSTHG